MSRHARIAFHTTLNAFDDHGISGDRRMARQLVDALRRLGHAVEPTLSPRTWMAAPDSDAFAAHRAAATAHGEALLAHWARTGSPPTLWFSYHNYYRAPDLLGPGLAAQLGIPYVIAEASDAARRMDGPWAAQAICARAGITAADVHFCFTARDRDGVAPWLKPGARAIDLPPFLDGQASAKRPVGPRGDGPPGLVAVAMMRPGNKAESYLALAGALARLFDLPWRLTLIGDGAMRREIEAAYAGFAPGRVIWRGALDRGEIAAAFAGNDVFVWPGLREAYGLVYLEAQAAGLPVVAFDSGGVPATVRPGETALLVPEADEAAFAQALRRLLGDASLRGKMSAAAQAFVREERRSDHAMVILAQGLAHVLARRP